MRPAAYRSASETSAGPHEKFNYTYDIVGHITGWRQEHSGSATPQRWELGYDAADRLVSGLLKHATTQALVKEVVFGFDRADNRLSEQIDTVIASDMHNGLNQLTSRGPGGWMRFRCTVDEPATVTVAGQPAGVTGAGLFEGFAPVAPGSQTISIVATDGSNNTRTSNFTVNVTSTGNRSLTYDANGNLLSDGNRTFLCDAGNRLIRVSYPGTNNRTEFVYDGLSRRVGHKEITNGTTTLDVKY